MAVWTMEKNVPGVTCLATALWIPGELGKKVVQGLPKEKEGSAGQPGHGGEWLPYSLATFPAPALCQLQQFLALVQWSPHPAR